MDSMQNSSGMSQPKSDGLAIDISALADSAKAKLGEIGGPVKDKAMEVAAEQKDAGAEHMQVAANAIRGAARELESSMPQIAGYVREAGMRLEEIASDIRNGSIDELLGKAGEFSKSQPVLLFGGAILAGFALSRFLKSSAQAGTSNLPAPADLGLAGMQTGNMTMQSGNLSGGMGQGYPGSGTLNNPGRTGGIS